MSTQLDLTPGSRVGYRDATMVITHLLDLETVLARDLESGQVTRLPITSLSPPPSEDTRPKSTDVDLTAVRDEDWKEANRRFLLIRPLLTKPDRTRQDVEAQANEGGVHFTTLYRWMQLYEATGRVSALLPPKPNGGRGKSRLSEEVEVILQATIEDEYLNVQRPNIQQTCVEVARRCRNAGLPPPHPNTVRLRIALISDKEKLRRRRGPRQAEEEYGPQRGSFPGADWPLAVTQIDHTQLDIVVVDDVYRRPVGRPWITLIMDVYSRMVLGFYISLDPPGALSTGLCIAHAVLPKEKWLQKLGINARWPCWGFPGTIHVDNAKEFRGNMLRLACGEYGVTLQFRPVKKPNYGGHIERLLGTFLTELHALPGTTFSNPAERGDYDPEKHAAMTLSELETWLATYITSVYHLRLHSGIGTSPLQRWEEGILGTAKQPGVGFQSRSLDEDRVRLDFMPYIERTVQQYGVEIDGIAYYNDRLRRHIKAKDPVNPKCRRRFRFRRDPRDISVVYFFDPEANEYCAIPYRDTSHRPISVWELRDAKRRLKEEARSKIDERAIFSALNQLRETVDNAKRQTTHTRRAAQRRRAHDGVVRPLGLGPRSQGPAVPAYKVVTPPPEASAAEEAPLAEPFEEIEVNFQSEEW